MTKYYRRKLHLSLLLGLALTLCIVIPGAAVNNTQGEENLISPEYARDLAQEVLIVDLDVGIVDEYGDNPAISDEPQIIYDRNGLPLSYLFEVLDDGIPVGSIWISARRNATPSRLSPDENPTPSRLYESRNETPPIIIPDQNGNSSRLYESRNETPPIIIPDQKPYLFNNIPRLVPHFFNTISQWIPRFPLTVNKIFNTTALWK
jgi:hypothetical protein